MYEEEKAAANEVQYASKEARPRTTNGVGLAEPTKAAPVINEAIAQADIIDGLVNAISRLETSIGPVLSGEYPADDEKSEPSRGESKMYTILDANNRALTNMTRYVNRLASRVEL